MAPRNKRRASRTEPAAQGTSLPRRSGEAAKAGKSQVREMFESICVAVILAFFVRTFVVQAFKIPSGSMEPNLLIGDHLLVNKFVAAPTLSKVEDTLLPIETIRRGDIIVFKHPDRAA
jgi:signal peptidase I